MKTQSFEKKLTLNKKTVANLGNSEMNRIQGGLSPAAVCISVILCIETLPENCETSRLCP